MKMTSAEDPPDVMTESAPVLKTAPRPRVTGTAAPRSVRVKRGRGTAMRTVTVMETLGVGLAAVTLREAGETAAPAKVKIDKHILRSLDPSQYS